MQDPQRLSLARPPDERLARRWEALRLDDGTATPVLRHVPFAVAGPPVLYLHGIQSHPGWFVGSAQALARWGHEVFQVTRRGSGPARRDRGDAPSAGRLLEDLDAAVRYVRRQSGSESLAMLGVSWGGKLATAYMLARAPTEVSSLTLVAPGIAARVDLPLGAKLAVALARCLRPRARFRLPLNDPELFTDNPAMQDYLRRDRHRLLRATARFLTASAWLDRMIARAPGGALRVPTTLVLARGDRIIDNLATRRRIARLTGGRAEVVELDGAHTLEFEPDPGPFHEVLRRAVRAAGPGQAGTH